MNQKYTVKYKEVSLDYIRKYSGRDFEDDNNYYQIELISDPHKDKISQSLNVKKQSSIFYTQFENEELTQEWIIAKTIMKIENYFQYFT